MKMIILFTFFFSSVLIAQQTAEYQYSFILSDEFNNSEELILGKDPFGSDGIDTLFGEEFVPHVPAGEFGARFQLPIDTSITTTKDIRFGCYWGTGHEHLIDISYTSGSSSISVDWEWDSLLIFGLMHVTFLNPYNGQILSFYSWPTDSSFFQVPISLDKIEIWTMYNGTLSTEVYDLYNPNGGEIVEGGSIYTITYYSFQLFPGLNIEFSSDSGQTWEFIVENYWSPSMTYDWQVPEISSLNCLIRLGDYPCVYDVSDSVFTITYPVSAENENNLPTKFSLSQNYPNPFNPSTKIKYSIPGAPLSFEEGLVVRLIIYDVLGNEVATLVNEEQSPGEYEVEFSVGQESIPALPSGIYFYTLKAGEFVQTKKMVLLK